VADPTTVPETADAGVPTPDTTSPQDPAATGAPIDAPDAMPAVEAAAQEDQAAAQPQATSSAPGTPTTSSEPVPQTEPDLPVDYTDPSTAYIPPQTTGTDADLLTGPPTDGESGAPYSGAANVPSQAQHWLPALQTAADAPGAPAEFQNLLKLVVANIQAAASGE
jgi:hypothetical protein